jgi:hypothetical protein
MKTSPMTNLIYLVLSFILPYLVHSFSPLNRPFFVGQGRFVASGVPSTVALSSAADDFLEKCVNEFTELEEDLKKLNGNFEVDEVQ